MKSEKEKTVLIEIISKYKQDPNRPRPKWWDNFVGEKFRCYDRCDGWWNLSTIGLKKMQKLKGGSLSSSAIIHKDCGKSVNR